MKKTVFFLGLLLSGCSLTAWAQRSEVLLERDWLFHRGEAAGAAAVAYDDGDWQRVTVPHDWAITGPFDRQNDLQKVAAPNRPRTISRKVSRYSACARRA